MQIELNRQQHRGQQVAAERLAAVFETIVRCQMLEENAVALYGFLLEVFDRATPDTDLTVPEFMEVAQEVLKERFPPVPEEEEDEAAA